MPHDAKLARRRRVTRRPFYRAAVEWIAFEDAPADGDSVDFLTGYLTVHLVADMFGAAPSDVAEDVAKVRLANGYAVGECET